MTKMDKEYIEKEYEQAIKEYNAALTETDKTIIFFLLFRLLMIKRFF